jgi:hypothetical protein
LSAEASAVSTSKATGVASATQQLTAKREDEELIRLDPRIVIDEANHIDGLAG